MKTPGACVGPQLPGRTRSFNLHCLSKRCCCVYSKKSSDSQIQGQGEQGYHCLFGETVFEPARDNRACARQWGSFYSASIFSETGYKTGKLNCRENSRCINIIVIIFSPPSPQDRTLHSKHVIATLWKDIHTGDLIIAISTKLKLSGCGVRGKMSILSGEKQHQVLPG